jgi:hypothetical protein
MDTKGITATQTNGEISVTQIIVFTRLENKRYAKYRKNVSLTMYFYIQHIIQQRVLYDIREEIIQSPETLLRLKG